MSDSEDEGCSCTDRVSQRAQISRNSLATRVIAKVQQPLKIHALALLRSGVYHNLINQKLVRQLQMVPSTTTETRPDPFTGDDLKLHGVHTLTFTVADHAGDERNFEIPFLVTEMEEDLVFGLEWLQLANPDCDFGKKTFHWQS